MKNARLRHILTVVDTILSLPPDEREPYLTEVCGEDAVLREEVGQLLESIRKSETFWDGWEDWSQRQVHNLFQTIDAHEQDVVQEHIGPWRLVRLLGRGGMGTVWLAERADGQFRRKAALKLMHLWMGPEEPVRRFARERQILARLDHPNIARLLDGDVTDDGQPYFVMEYVEGQPVDTYCDNHQLPIRQRLKLFLKVCDAVQDAHRKLIVHRDIKPSNILVNRDGNVKLLDFGIAKALNPDDILLESMPLTRTGVLPLTPAYASPEQMRGDPISTSSDIYQLGIVLYELLTGCSPYEVAGRTPGEIERIICEEEPVHLSDVLAKTPGSIEDTDIDPRQISGVRQTTPEQLRKQLRGDLDTIVMKSLRKEPERRYDSAHQLASDIRQYLSGRPVSAHPDSRIYRARKFVRLYKWTVAASCLALLFLLGGLAGTAWQAWVAANERDVAAQEAAKAREVAAFLTDLFKVADPGETQGEEVTARQVLDQGSQRIRQELAGQPEVQGEMLEVVAGVYRQMGMYEQALALVLEAITVRRQVLGPSHPDVAQSIHHAGVLYGLLGDFAAADTMLHEALSIRSAQLGEDHVEFAESLHSLAQLYQKRGDLLTAESLFVRALEIRRAELGEKHESVGSTLNDLGSVKRELGDYIAAESLLRQALSVHRQAFGDVHQRVAMSVNELAMLMVRRGDLEAAEKLYRESLALSMKLYGDEHPRVLNGLHNLARVLTDKENYVAADSMLLEAIRINRHMYGDRHPGSAILLSSRSTVLQRQGELDAAEALARESLALRREIYGTSDPNVVTGLSNLAAVHMAKGNTGQAVTLLREAVGIERALPVNRKPYLAVVLNNLGVALHANRDCEAAIPVLAETLELRQELLPAGHWRIADVKGTWGACLTALEEYEEAEALLTESYRVIAAELGEAHRNSRRVAGYLAVHYAEREQPADAERFRALAETQ